MLKKTLISAIFITQFLTIYSATATTLEEALANAYNHNHSLKSAKEQLKATDEKIFQAISNWLPNIRYNINNAKEKSHPIDYKYSPYQNNNNRQLTIVQPIYNYGNANFSNVELARNEVRLARAEFYKIEQEVLGEVVESYVTVILQTELVQLTNKNVEVLQKHLESAKERFKLGDLTKSELAAAEAELAAAISKKIESEGNLINAKSVYYNKVGLDPEHVQPITNLLTIPYSLDETINLSIQNNPSFLIAKYRSKIAKSSLSNAIEGFLPSAHLELSRGNNNRFNGNNQNFKQVTMNISIPLYQSGKEYSNIRANKHKVYHTKYELENVKQKIKTNTLQIWHAIQTSKATINASKKAVDAYKIAVEGITQEASLGTKTMVDLLDAEQKLFDKQVKYIESKNHLIFYLYNLKSTIGELNAKSLQLPVKIYDPNQHYNLTKFKFMGIW